MEIGDHLNPQQFREQGYIQKHDMDMHLVVFIALIGLLKLLVKLSKYCAKKLCLKKQS
jgi:hypothetical protein